MATPYQNAPNRHAWFRMTSNTVIQPSDALASNLEPTPTSLNITQILFTGPWTIYRGANVVFQSNGDYNGHWNLSGLGTSLSEYSTANIVCNTASSTATLLLQVNKNSYANGSYGGQQ